MGLRRMCGSSLRRKCGGGPGLVAVDVLNTTFAARREAMLIPVRTGLEARSAVRLETRREAPRKPPTQIPAQS